MVIMIVLKVFTSKNFQDITTLEMVGINLNLVF